MSTTASKSSSNMSEIFSSKTFPVVEMFYSLQGEGFHCGEAAFFIRLAGCRNACPFCDTPESWSEDGFPRLTTAQIIEAVKREGATTCVVTGGEPMLHALDGFCQDLHDAGLRLWLETSGSEPFSGQWDWVCLSPKQGVPVLPEYYHCANELKVVVQDTASLDFAQEQASRMEAGSHLFLQPEWNQVRGAVELAVDFILRHPRWRLSLQTHKFIGIM